MATFPLEVFPLIPKAQTVLSENWDIHFVLRDPKTPLLLMEHNPKSVMTLYDSNSSVRELLSGMSLNFLMTNSTSQMYLYLGNAGLAFEAPFMRSLTIGCFPTGIPFIGSWYAEMADLCVAMQLHSLLLSNKAPR